MEAELLAVGGEFAVAVSNVAVWRASLGPVEGYRDGIASLEAVPRPTGPSHPQRIVQLDRPMLHFALFVLCVEMQQAMRIVPVQARYRSVERNRLRHLVCRLLLEKKNRPGNDDTEQGYGAQG